VFGHGEHGGAAISRWQAFCELPTLPSKLSILFRPTFHNRRPFVPISFAKMLAAGLSLDDRERDYLQSGSAGLDAMERQAAAPHSRRFLATYVFPLLRITF
jgi:hypothetical protein